MHNIDIVDTYIVISSSVIAYYNQIGIKKVIP